MLSCNEKENKNCAFTPSRFRICLNGKVAKVKIPSFAPKLTNIFVLFIKTKNVLETRKKIIQMLSSSNFASVIQENENY